MPPCHALGSPECLLPGAVTNEAFCHPGASPAFPSLMPPCCWPTSSQAGRGGGAALGVSGCQCWVMCTQAERPLSSGRMQEIEKVTKSGLFTQGQGNEEVGKPVPSTLGSPAGD